MCREVEAIYLPTLKYKIMIKGRNILIVGAQSWDIHW
jgi:hypothetical protein